MNAATSSVVSGPAHTEVSLFRLYTLRVSYLILAVGLGTYIWPSVIHHTNELAIAKGPLLALLAGIGTTAIPRPLLAGPDAAAASL